MGVPYVFSTYLGGGGIPLSQLDDNFSYLSDSPTLNNLSITGNLTVGGTSTFNGPTVFNNNSITINGQQANPTGFTGTGLIVLNNTPTLISPILGTPTSGNLANCTNLPISTGVSGLGAGVATALSNPPDTPGGFLTYNSHRGVPAGAVFHFAATTAPAGYLVCDGSAYATTVYPDLFAVVGYTFGGAGGTFNVPDLTGAFVRGVGGNSAAFGQIQADGISAHNHGVTDPGHTHTITDPGHLHTIVDPGHNHTLNDPGHTHAHTDPGHSHSINDPSHTHGASSSDSGHTHQISGTGPNANGGGNGWLVNPQGFISSTLTGFANITTSIAGAFTGVSNNPNTTGLTNNVNTTGITIANDTTGITDLRAVTDITNNKNVTGVTTNNTGINETRPLNMSLLPCIKY
jgi:microcystin-dependent protein